jgi:drug/metabolite transporter (DMT)-like permease
LEIDMLNIAMTLLFAIIMGAGQIVLSYASKDIFSGGSLSIRVIVASKWLWLGIFVYAFAMMFWVYILSKFDVKYAYPISSSAIFFAAIFQSLLQKTLPTSNYWLGLALVTFGIVALSLDYGKQ